MDKCLPKKVFILGIKIHLLKLFSEIFINKKIIFKGIISNA